MESFEKYMKAVEIMMRNGMDYHDIRAVTGLVIGSFKQGTGLGGSDIDSIINIARTGMAYDVKLVEIAKAKNLPSGSHAPKYAIISKIVECDSIYVTWVEDGKYIASSSADQKKYDVVIYTVGNTVREAWENFAK